MSDEHTHKTHRTNCCCLACVWSRFGVETTDEIERLHKESEQLATRNALLVIEIEELKTQLQWMRDERNALAKAVQEAHAELNALNHAEDDQ
jgi:septal ring factor EnvC (AmiA/AmiB activator)